MADVKDKHQLAQHSPAAVAVTNADGGVSAADAVVVVNADGTIATPASDATQQLMLTELQNIDSAVSTPVSELPPPALSTTKRLARAVASSSTATTTSLVSATASQTTRLHRAIISCAGACLVELLDGTTNAKTIRFPGSGVAILDFAAEPWVITSVNTALQFKTSAAVQVDVDVEYVKSA
jgi:hypothetical protein